MSGVLDAHGQPTGGPQEQGKGIDAQSGPAQIVAVHVAQDIGEAIAVELLNYVKRNAVPSGQLHVNIARVEKRKEIRIEFTRAQNGLRIVTAPARRLKIKWSVEGA